MSENSKIERLLSFCNDIQSQSKRSEKEFRLRAYRCKDFDCLLKFLLDDNRKTNISTSRINKNVSKNSNVTDMTLFELIDYACSRNGDDECLANIQHYIRVNCKNEAEILFVKQVITKTIKLGITAQTVNKVYGGNFIPVFSVQLSKSIENVTIPEGSWFSISQKINGNRCMVYRGKPYSRQGKEWHGLDHIIEDLRQVVDLNYFAIDGELVYSNHEGLNDNDAFLKGTGILNSDGDKSNIKFIIFDLIPNEEFELGESSLTYKARKNFLRYTARSIEDLSLKNIEVVKFFYEGTDQIMIEQSLTQATMCGMEGIMINLDTTYKCKRHAGLIKAKKFYTMDLPIVAVNAGEGKLFNTLGSLDVTLTIEDKTGIVSVGSGFCDEDRDALWDCKEQLIGKIIEVKYKNITKDKNTGLPSLQFPVFIRFREDKTEASID